MFTQEYLKDGMRVVFRRMRNSNILRRELYIAAMSEVYPQADYISPVQDKLIAEQQRRSDAYARYMNDNVQLGTELDKLDKVEDQTIPPSERAKYDAAKILNRAISGLSALLAGITEHSDTPFPIPEPEDKAGVKAILDLFLDGEYQSVFDDWADIGYRLNAPLTSATERPAELLNEAQQADPLFVANELSMQDG